MSAARQRRRGLDWNPRPELPPRSAYQILPDQDHWTIDIPDCRLPFSGASEPVWRWLTDAVDESLNAVVDLEVGKGLWRDANGDEEWHPWGDPAE